MSDNRGGTSVLFVCLGNICRSPIAEGVFIHQARDRGAHDRFDVESAGTGGWHIGERPDKRALAVAKKNGVELPSRARQVDPANDFRAFDLIIPMDAENRRDLLALGAPDERVRLLRSFDPELVDAQDDELCVPDPYYGGASGFDMVFDMVWRACVGMLDEHDA